jgi:hypothetical protein
MLLRRRSRLVSVSLKYGSIHVRPMAIDGGLATLRGVEHWSESACGFHVPFESVIVGRQRAVTLIAKALRVLGVGEVEELGT